MRRPSSTPASTATRRATSTTAAIRIARASIGRGGSSSRRSAPSSRARNWPTIIRSSATPTMRPMSTRSSPAAAARRAAAAACSKRRRSAPARAPRQTDRRRAAAKFGAARRDDAVIDLRTRDFAVRDGFLTPQQVVALAECAAVRRERGDFAAARIGAGPAPAAPRGDSRRFDLLADASRCIAAERDAARVARAAALQLNRERLFGPVRIGAALRVVPAGSRLCAPCRSAARTRPAAGVPGALPQRGLAIRRRRRAQDIRRRRTSHGYRADGRRAVRF